MMKYLASLLLFLAGQIALAQNCTPDQSITKPGIYPSYLDTGMVGASYSHTLQILAVKDTNVLFNGTPITATVDSVVLNDILGLPPSFNFGCEPANCVYTSDNVGCAILQGDPNQSEQGEHPLKIIVTSYARYGSFKLPVKDTIDNFVLVIEDSSTTSVSLKEKIKLQVLPNPVYGNTVKVSLNTNAHNALLYNTSGVIVKEFSIVKSSAFYLDLNNIASGVYTLMIETDHGIIHEKLLRIEQ